MGKALVIILFGLQFLVFNASAQTKGQSDRDQMSGKISNTYANYLVRTLTEFGEGPDLKVKTPNLEEALRSIEKYLDSTEFNLPLYSFEYKAVKFYHEIYKLAVDSLHEVDGLYSLENVKNLSPLDARKISFEHMIENKKKALSIVDSFVSEIKSKSRENVAWYDVDIALRSILDTRMKMSKAEITTYKVEIVEPLSETLIDFYSVLFDKSPELYTKFIRGLFRNFEGNDKIHLIEKVMLELAESKRWMLDSDMNGQEGPNRFFNFNFMMQNKYKLESMKKLSFTDLVDEDEIKRYHEVWEKFYPENMIDYLVSDDSFDHQEFILMLKIIQSARPSMEEAWIKSENSVKVSKDFEEFMTGEILTLNNRLDKGFTDLQNVIHAFFAGYVPAESKKKGEGAFDPNSVSVASLINSRTIVSLISYNISHSDFPLTLKQFYERLLYDFIRLAKNVEPIGPGVEKTLTDLFYEHSILKLKSKWIKKLAEEWSHDSIYSKETRLAAMDYLIAVDEKDYAYLKKTKDILKKSYGLKSYVLDRSDYSGELRILEAGSSNGSLSAPSLVSPSFFELNNFKSGVKSCSSFL